MSFISSVTFTTVSNSSSLSLPFLLLCGLSFTMKALLGLLLISVAFAQRRLNELPDLKSQIRSSILIPAGARCKNEVPAFFYSENMEMVSDNSLKYKRMSEDDCLTMCVDNLDKKDRSILCAGATYDKERKTCSVHRVKAEPDGIMPLEKAHGKTYIEKFCLPSNAPIDCGEAKFIRIEQKVLIGFARNVTVADSIEDCARVCLNEKFYCKSALYFNDGECITNSARKDEVPEDLFVDEVKDKVTYFENGCRQPEKEIKGKPKSKANIRDKKAKSKAKRKNKNKNKNKNQRSQVLKEAKSERKSKIVKKEIEKELTTPKPLPVEGYTHWSEWSSCDRRQGGRRIRRRHCTLDNINCHLPRLESQDCSKITIITTTTSTKVPTTTTTTTTQRPLINGLLLQWGPWQGECQLFTANQQCINNMRIGFQNRKCNGNPFLCRGPFFRYCTVPC